MNRLAGLSALLCLSAGPAVAADLVMPAYSPQPVATASADAFDSDWARAYGISELRAGVMMDDIELYSTPVYIVPRPESFHLDNIGTLSADVLYDTPDLSRFFTKPDLGGWNWLLSPRPTFGIDLDLKHESMVHASLNWHIPVADTPFFVETELGAALHNGALTDAVPPMRNLGCRALFYWSLNIGYQLTDHWNLLATEQHASQDGLCGWHNNQGINYDGVRLSYKF